MATTVNHPSKWLICDICEGTGVIEGDQCHACSGAGFQLSFERAEKGKSRDTITE